nr:solute carrier family 22 member 4-like [Ciona intestinalis]|eukprot:XP_009862016.1 solute carrier family 22 member 4-like [Ciona intestinalis]
MGILPKFKDAGFGWYEFRMCLLIVYITMPTAFQIFQVLVSQFTPEFYCQQQSLLGDTTQFDVNNSTNGMLVTDDVCTIPKSNHLTTDNSSYIKDVPVCTSIVYTGNYTSASIEFDMVCDNGWRRPLYSSLFMIGMTIGGIFGGGISDRFGRRIVVLVFTFWQFILALATSFVADATTYGILFFFSGFGCLVSYQGVAVMGWETVPPSFRSFMFFIQGIAFACSYLLFGLATWIFQDWRWFLRAYGIAGVFYIPSFWLFDETVPWLLVNKRHEEADLLRNKIAKINRNCNEHKTEDSDVKNVLLEMNEKQNLLKAFKSILKSPYMFIRVMIISLSWFTVSLVYFAIALNTNGLKGDRILNIVYAALAELGSAILYFCFVRMRGHRNCYIGFMTLCMISLCITLAVDQGVVAGFTMFSKLMVGTAFLTVYTYSGELFPTNIRQSLLGYFSGLSRVAASTAPYIIYAEKGNNTTPTIITVTLVSLSIVGYMFLPKTKGKKLPQTVKEANSMRGGLLTLCKNEQKVVAVEEP